MKRYTLFLALLAVLMLPACDVLDVSPSTSIRTDEVFTDGRNFRAALVGAYSAVQSMHDDYTIMPELSGDNAAHTGSFPSWSEVDTYNLTTNNAESGGQWAGSYNVIDIANNIIANADKVPLTLDFKAGERDNIVAQAKVLRAYAYHNLVRWFGSVPIVLTPTTEESVKNPEITYPSRASVDAVYDQIIKDLTEAEATLTTTSGRQDADKATATALLSRIYLYQRNWQQAAAKAQEVLSNSSFTLQPSLSNVYDTQGSPESVWELFYSDQDQNSMAFFAYPSNAGGRREYAPTTNLAGAFAANDLRRPYNINTAGTLIIKYNDPVNGTDSHYPIRLAEVILTRAEALAQLGQLDEARTLLNQIRTRAGLDNTTATTQQEVLDAIIAERRLELAFEGHRWHDLVRTGRAVSVLAMPDPNKQLWPVPQRDIDLNKNLTQNEGY